MTLCRQLTQSRQKSTPREPPARIASVPQWRLVAPSRNLSRPLICKDFDPFGRARVWQPECRYEVSDGLQSLENGCEMDGPLAKIPTDSLIEMLFIIITGELAMTANDGTEIEQIQRELQRRGEDQYWSFCIVH
jgi:hypothetical protein